MIKNIELKHLMFNELILCYGLKNYKKVIDKYGLDYIVGLTTTGQCTTFYYEVENKRKLIIGLKKKSSSKEVKNILLHEIVHAVTFIMEAHAFECDEYRAYTTCSLFEECCDALDVHLADVQKLNNKTEKTINIEVE